MDNWGIITWTGVIIVIVVLLVYTAGTVANTKAFSGAATSYIGSLMGPGKYASGNAKKA